MRTNEKTIENLVETRWLPRYPWVMEIIYYQLPEFICRVLKYSLFLEKIWDQIQANIIKQSNFQCNIFTWC